MSHDRINGAIWGFNIGLGLATAVAIHPVMIVFSIAGIAGLFWFGARPKNNRSL